MILAASTALGVGSCDPQTQCGLAFEGSEHSESETEACRMGAEEMYAEILEDHHGWLPPYAAIPALCTEHCENHNVGAVGVSTDDARTAGAVAQAESLPQTICVQSCEIRLRFEVDSTSSRAPDAGVPLPAGINSL